MKLKKLFFTLLFLICFQDYAFSSGNKININLNNENFLETYTNFQEKDDDYLLGAGDLIEIKFEESISDLNQEAIIDGNGLIDMPYLGRMYVEGLTLFELEKVLNKKYINIIKNPSFSLRILAYRQINVYLMGEVQEPGMYTFSGSANSKFNPSSGFDNDSTNILPDLSPALDKENKDFDIQNSPSFEEYKIGLNRSYFPTLFDVLRRSGGITNFSDLSNIRIIRYDTQSNGGGKKETYVNFLDVIEKGDFSKNLRIYDKDSIIVKKSSNVILGQLSNAIKTNLNPKYVKVFVSGRVATPGVMYIPKSSSLSDAIDVAGGAKVLRGKTTLIRFNSDGISEKRVVSPKRGKRGTYNNPYLKSGDIVRVGKGPINTVSEILSDITQPVIGSYTFYSIYDDVFN